MEILNQPEIYVDRSKVEEHQRIFKDYLKMRDHANIKQIDEVTLDSSIYNTNDISMLERLKTPIFFVTEDGSIEINMNNHITLTQGEGKKSVKGQSTRKFNYIDTADWWYYLQPVQRTDAEHGVTTLNVKSQKSQSILSELGRWFVGQTGEMLKMNQTVVVSRVSEGDDYTYLFCKLFLYLMNCNVYYSTQGAEVEGETDDDEGMIYTDIVHVTPKTLPTLLMDHSTIINIDSFAKQELDLMCIAARSWPSCTVTHGAGESIYSKVEMDSCDIRFVSEKGAYTNSSTCTVLPPEVAWHSICEIARKLGAIHNMVEAIQKMRGVVPTLQHMSKIDGKQWDDGDESIMINVQETHGCGTVLGNVANQRLRDQIRHTNLFASSVNLLLDQMIGQDTINRFHLLCETLGLCNEKLYNKKDLTASQIFQSILREHGMYTLGRDNKLLEWFFNGNIIGDDSWLRAKIIKYQQLLLKYTSRDLKHKDNAVEDITWLPAHVIFGQYNEGNSSEYAGRGCVIGPDTLSARVRDVSKSYELMAWLHIHGLDRKIPVGGLNLIGKNGAQEISRDTRIRLETMCGSYLPTYYDMTITNNYSQRSGYETCSFDTIYHHNYYKSVGSEYHDEQGSKFTRDGQIKEREQSDDEIRPPKSTLRPPRKEAEEVPEDFEAVKKDEADLKKALRTHMGGAPSSIRDKLNALRNRSTVNVIDVPGDGRCTFHALAKSMSIALGHEIDADQLMEQSGLDKGSELWGDQGVIAEIAHNNDFGLDVYVPQEMRIERYNTDLPNRVAVSYDADRAHYDAVTGIDTVLDRCTVVDAPTAQGAIDQFAKEQLKGIKF